MFGETFNDLNRSFRERTRGGLVDLEREWKDFLRGLSEENPGQGCWEPASPAVNGVLKIKGARYA